VFYKGYNSTCSGSKNSSMFFVLCTTCSICMQNGIPWNFTNCLYCCTVWKMPQSSCWWLCNLAFLL